MYAIIFVYTQFESNNNDLAALFNFENEAGEHGTGISVVPTLASHIYFA